MIASRRLFSIAPILVALALGASNVAQASDRVDPSRTGVAAGPGTNGTATLCSSGAAVQLINYLGGSPDPGGTWSGPAGHPGTFNPATDAPGTFTYTVPGPPVASATVTVVVHQLPVAGTSGALTVCSTDAPLDLFTLLGGSPDGSGAWTLNGNPVGNIFTPGTSAAGTYVYTVTGTPPCPDATAQVVMGVSTMPVAGTNGALTVCSTDAPIDLFTLLGGSPDGSGAWTLNGNPVSNIFTPGTSAPGTYLYTVTGTPPCPNATAQVVMGVSTMPVAGTDGALTVCSTDAPLDLFTLLGGSPDGSGAWTLNGNPVSNIFTPGTSAAGTYLYTVTGTPPCPSATAQVVMGVVDAPKAGTDRSIVVCSDDAAFSMLGQLGGTPDPGGTWSPGGSGTFTPGTTPAGNYTYTVAGTPPCASDVAVLSITVRKAPDAGTNRSVFVCSDGAVFSLLDSLGGTPDAGGTWTGPGGAHSGQFQPGTDASGPYVYTVAGQPPCAPATATVTVTVRAAPNAGTNANVVKCSNAPSFTLISQLGGTPSPGGSWTGPGGAPFPSGNFVPGTTPPGLYTYTVTGLSPCVPAVATVNVSIVAAPNAGTPGIYKACSSDGSFALFPLLGGNPDVGGTWTGPGNVAVPSGNFIPGTSASGVYVYRVTGTAPCTDATATVTVTVVTAANAGSNGSVTLCNTSSNTNLFASLGGSPATGGTWTMPSPPGGVLAGGIYQPANPAHPAGTYTYTVTGTAPCPNVSATVLVVEHQAPIAGVNGTSTFCSTNPPFNMATILGGSPGTGGIWLNAANATVPATFTPGTTAPGTYRYVLTGIAPCVNDTAQATINVNAAPVAGTNGAVVVCSDDAPVDLFLQLGGSPDPGGTWKNPNNVNNNGSFVPGPGAVQGGYTYLVAGLSPCADASAVVTVTQHRRPVAGTSATLPLCSTDGPVNLFDHLGGTPDAGGTWTGPGGSASNGVFIPAAAGTFAYKYKVTGTSPCGPDSATVTVTVTQAPNAGTSGTITICSGQATVDLFDGLGGSPDLNGTWSEITVTGRLSSNFFNPGTPTQLPAGNYDFRYVVLGSGLCAADTATVRVTIVPLLNAGNSGSASACNTQAQVNLFAILGGSPQPGGTWVDLDATGQVTGQYFNANGSGPGTFHFRYKLTGALGCNSDSAQVTVTVVAGPNAGHEGWATFCSDGPPVSLVPYISPANGGGTWRKPAPGNEVFSGTYIPSTFNPGDYTYTVSGSGPCSAAVAVLHISETTGPNPGLPAQVTKCANEAPFDMTAALGGTPDPNGTWTGPGTASHTSTFVPGQDAPGVYIYTVAGTFPCTNKSSSLTVNVNPLPMAGGASTVNVCDNAAPFLLINHLPGAQMGGVWRDPLLVPFPSGTYIPGTSLTGMYTYEVAGSSPCATATGTVTVFEVVHPEAGRDTTVAACLNSASFPLVNLLGGPHDATGTWTGPAPSHAYFSGTFQPGSNAPGVYTYHVSSIPPCPADSSTVAVFVATPPMAGLSRTIQVCSNAGLFAMVDSLGGTPDLNGTWVQLPSGASNGIFNPAIPAGTYTFQYTVQPTGNSPCGPAQATLTIKVTGAPNAGGDGNLPLCTTSGITPLFPSLTGSPQAGGTWSFSGLNHSSSFNPASDVSGSYQYAVMGTGGCRNDTAVVTVAVNAAPIAGSNGVLTICDDTLAAIVLRDVLNGTPATGGTWVNAVTGLPADEIYLPGNYTTGIHTFTYTVPGTAPCPTATAQATIIQNAEAVAGNDASLVVCTNSGNVDMFPLLGPAADPSGSWINAGGTYASSVFVPGDHAAGLYAYRFIVMGNTPCVNDTATVTITVNRKPNAGVSTAPQLCANGPMISLASLLGGTPDAGGTWAYHPTTGSPVPHGATFNPATDPHGAYVYTVSGVAPCTNSTATVQITLVPQAHAGAYGTMSACVSDTHVHLFNGLQGTPQSGGTWTDLDNSGQLVNGLFNASAAGAGTYRFRYTLAATGPCPADTASVKVTVTPELDAGEDAAATFCLSEVNFLTPFLGGTPQPGGTWTGIESQAGLINGVLNGPAVGEGTWHYRYVLSGSANCAPDSALLAVTILTGPQAGSGVNLSICSSMATLDLFSQLGQPYDTNGQWYHPDSSAMASSLLDPASDPSGLYFYVVPAIGNCPADTAWVNVSITAKPEAGTNGSLSFCANGAPGLLSAGLGGNPDTTGSWTFGTPGLTHGPAYNPATDQPGNYVYTVAGHGPCTSTSATVLVSEVAAPFAGGDNTYTFCSSGGAFNMFDKLSLNPQAGGVWRRDGSPPTPHPATYNPAVDSSGVFLYIRNGSGPCANDTARLTVVEVPEPRAGTGATLQVCPSDTLVNLFAALGPDADSTGSWTDGNNDPWPDSLFNAAEVPVGSYVFTYTVTGTAPCADATATITVEVGAGLNAGVGGTDTICGGLTAYDLFGSLDGDPDPGGVWAEQLGTGAITGNNLNATLLPPGSAYPMVYTLNDPTCGDVQSVVNLFIFPYPDPGADTAVTRCATDAPFALASLVPGAMPGGSWVAPGGSPSDGQFNPGSSQPGQYSYVLEGNAFCPDTLARVSVAVNAPADAGDDSMGQVCNEGSVELFPLLTGSAQPGGTWEDLDGSGALANGVVGAGALAAGQYRFRYHVVVEGCASDSSEVALMVVDAPQVSDVVRTCNEQDRTYVVSFTITGGAPASYSVSGGPGSLSAGAPYVFTSGPILTSQSFQFTLDDANHCEPVTVEGTTPCQFPDDVFIPESFTPNGDGSNDTFVIPGIEGYPANSIVIFNRWGGQVYKATGYDNRRTVWDGSSPDALLPGDASTGTYYYVLDLGNGTEPLKGFVYLNR